MNKPAQIVNINRVKRPVPSKNGFVMAWRDMRMQPWYSNPDCVAVFTHIMLSATSKPLTYNRKGAVCQLAPGDYVTTYDELGAQFGLDKSTVRRIIANFIKNGQITKKLIAVNRINKGFVVSLTGWDKWQNNDVLADTLPDTRPDTWNVTNIKGLSTYADTLPDTLPDTVLNNKVINNIKRYAGQAPLLQKVSHIKIREAGFEHFWQCWNTCKKIVGKTNTSPKAKFKTKFLTKLNDSHIEKISVAGFKAEINLMCELATIAHQDIADSNTAKTQSDYFNYASMYPDKYLTNSQWRECDDYRELVK